MSFKETFRKSYLFSFLKFCRDCFLNFKAYFLKKVFPKGKFIRKNNCKIYVDFNDNNSIWYYDHNKFLIQEHEAFKTLTKQKQPNVILDIGAHQGIFPAMLDHDRDIGTKIKKLYASSQIQKTNLS